MGAMKRRNRSSNRSFRMGSWGRRGRQKVSPRLVQALEAVQNDLRHDQPVREGSPEHSCRGTNVSDGADSAAVSKGFCRDEMVRDSAVPPCVLDSVPVLPGEEATAVPLRRDTSDLLGQDANLIHFQSELMAILHNSCSSGHFPNDSRASQTNVDNADNQSIRQSSFDDSGSYQGGAGEEFVDEAADPPSSLLGPEELDGFSDERSVGNSGVEDTKGIEKLLMWQNMLAITLLPDSGRLSHVQYKVVGRCINAFITRFMPNEPGLPSYSTVQRTLLSMPRKWSYVASMECSAVVDKSKSGARFTTDAGDEGSKMSKFGVVLPSSWSSVDLSCHSRWHLLNYNAEHCRSEKLSSNFLRIEQVQVVRDSHSILNITDHVFPFRNGSDGACSLLMSTSSGGRAKLGICFNLKPNFPDFVLRHIRLKFSEADCQYFVNVFVKRTVLVEARKPDEVALIHTQDEVPTATLRSGEFKALMTETGDLWRARDLFTLVTTSMTYRYVLILVHHHVPTSSPQTVEMVYIPFSLITLDGRGDTSQEICKLLFHLSRTAKVSAVDAFSTNLPDPTLRYLQSAIVPIYGRLSIGMPYFVDNILLYSDEFSQYNFKQGSAGGVYCLSLNYPPEIRRSRSRVRVLSLTPPGIATAANLEAVIDEIVKSCTTGHVVQYADGENMLLFLNVVGYVCDYHELMTVLDVVGQNGCAPCHLCAFLRYGGHHSTGSRYCYITEMHSSDSCFARSGSRTQALRDSHLADEKQRRIGLKNSAAVSEKRSPLHMLYQKLNKSLHQLVIPVTDKQVPVVSPSFDPYRSALLAPDYLLQGLAINCLELAFKSLPDKKTKKLADALITQMLSTNSLVKESRVYNFNKSSLYQTSISGTFCKFFVAAPVLSGIAAKLFSTNDEELLEPDARVWYPLFLVKGKEEHTKIKE